MSETCNGNCSGCGEACDSRQAESLLAQANPLSDVKKVIAVVSGKGGVGKSTGGATTSGCWMRILPAPPFLRP